MAIHARRIYRDAWGQTMEESTCTCESSNLWDCPCPTLITCTCRCKNNGLQLGKLSTGPTLCDRQGQQFLRLVVTMRQEDIGSRCKYNIPWLHKVIQFAVKRSTCESSYLWDCGCPTLITCTSMCKQCTDLKHTTYTLVLLPTPCNRQSMQCLSLIGTMREEVCGWVCM